MKPPSLIEKAFFLKRVRLFSEIEFELLLSIAEKLHEDDYDANEKIFSMGQAANRIYLIEKGVVQLVDERAKPIVELEEGDFFADESIFNDNPRSYGAICKTDAVLYTLSRSHLLSIISECPTVAIALLQIYASALPCRHIEPLA
jgi:CRP/FNR family transcriptional regulator, cyclic AMP receptor protein